jgi:hypothetical protein
MLTETLLTIPFSVIGQCSLVPTSHWLQGKCGRNNLSQAAACKHFQCQNRCCRVFENVKTISACTESIVPIYNYYKHSKKQ